VNAPRAHFADASANRSPPRFASPCSVPTPLALRMLVDIKPIFAAPQK
jgi:hypothetical protein